MPTQDWRGKIEALIERIRNGNGKINENSKKLLLDFYRELKINDYSLARIHKLLTHLIKVAERFPELDLGKADRGDIRDIVLWVQERDVSPETKKDYRIALRVFYKWLDLGSVRAKGASAKVADLNTTTKKKDEKLPEDMLTEDDVKRLIGHATNARTRCLISML